MQAWKPPVKDEKSLGQSADGKIKLSSVILPGGKGKAGILVEWVNVFPGTAYPNRFDVMSEVNWNTFLGSFLPSLQQAFQGINAVKEKAAQERKEHAVKTAETIKATGLPAVAANAAIVATLKAEGYSEVEVKEYASVA